MAKSVIFAPHIDDEVIGCWRLLCNNTISDVYYFFEHTESRKKEALAAARKYKFTPHFVSVEVLPVVAPEATIFLPHIRDAHTHHKMVNYIGKNYNNELRYYSIDMNVTFDVLSSEESAQKKLELLQLFPSQSKLLENDKYSLFEANLSTDVSVTKTYVCKEFVVTMEQTEKIEDEKVVATIDMCGSNINKILALFPFRKIFLKQGNLEFNFDPS